MLCHLCSKVLGSLVGLERRLLIPHLSVADLEQSDCPLCQVIHHSFNQMSPGRAVEIHLQPHARAEWPKLKDQLQKVELEINISGALLYRSLTVFRLGPTLTQLCRSKWTDGNASTGSIGNLRLAQYWYQTCRLAHESCRLSSMGRPPTRLLHLRGGIRLVPGSQSDGVYAALSHRWGLLPICTTTIDTLESHKAGIPHDRLPATFKDAISAVRSIGINYLWIDSLCITQDDQLDWIAESARMGDYYSNAALTIAAVSATQSSEGCFASSPIIGRMCVPVDSDAGNGLFVRRATEIYPGDAHVLWTRGWTLQERILSARLLSFGNSQMTWRCQVGVASELIPEGISITHETSASPPKSAPFDDDFVSTAHSMTRQEGKDYEGDSLRGDKQSSLRQSALVGFLGNVKSGLSFQQEGTDLKESSDVREKLEQWYDLVAEYSKCALTKASDNYPALSGIARKMASDDSAVYAAGLWPIDIRRGLAWFVRGGDRRVCIRDPKTLSKPSWSWASSTHPICYGDPASQFVPRRGASVVNTDEVQDVPSYMFLVHKIHISPAEHHDAFGEISSGELVLKTMLHRGSPQPCMSPDIAGKLHFYKIFTKYSEGIWFPDNCDENFDEVLLVPLLKTESDVAPTYHCVAITGVEDQAGSKVQLYGLPVYRRVGFVRMHAYRPIFTEEPQDIVLI